MTNIPDQANSAFETHSSAISTSLSPQNVQTIPDKGFVHYYPFEDSSEWQPRVSERMLRDLMLVEQVGWEESARIMSKRLRKKWSADNLQKWYESSPTLKELFRKEIENQEFADITKAEYERLAAEYALGIKRHEKGQFEFFELLGRVKGYIKKEQSASGMQLNQQINFVQGDGKE